MLDNRLWPSRLDHCPGGARRTPAGTVNAGTVGAGPAAGGDGGSERVPPVGVAGFEAAEEGPDPEPFVAVTVKVYVTPFVSPDTTTGLPEPLPVAPPGDAVTMYDDTAEPPSASGAEKITDT